MGLKVPYNLQPKIANLPESSPGVCQATLVLLDGRKIEKVSLTRDGEIMQVRDRSVNGIHDLDFGIFEIKDVLPEP